MYWFSCTYLNNELQNEHIPASTTIIDLKVSEHTDCLTEWLPWHYCPDRQDIFIDNLNQGASIISILGISGGPESFGGWFWAYDNRESLPHPDIDFSSLNNVYTGMPFLIAANCHQGEVNNPDGFESSMRKLMVYDNGGIIGAIAPTVGSVQHECGYILYMFNDLIFQDEAKTYGETFKTLKDSMFANFELYEFFNNGLTFFGDPSMIPSIYKHRSGSLASSATWSGNFVIEGLTVQEGANLTIQPGTSMFFPDYAQFWVNGTLTANGNEQNKIMFDFISPDDFDYNGIHIAEGGNIIINNSTVQNAYNGIYIDIDGWNSMIRNSTIQNCYNGIIANIIDQHANILIDNNTIENNSNYGIKISGSDFGLENNLEVSNNTVSNCAHGMYLTGMNDVIINGSLLDHCTHGIYIYDSQLEIIDNEIIDPYGNGIYGEANGKSPLIQNNIIKKITNNLHNYQGIYLQNFTNPFITGNDIQGFDYGIYYGGGGSGNFTDANFFTPDINNRLVNNVIGLTAAWGSYLTAGTPKTPSKGGKNSIWDNSSYDATAYQNGSIIASKNWWGSDGAQTYTYSGGYITATSPLISDPWDGIPLHPDAESIPLKLNIEFD